MLLKENSNISATGKIPNWVHYITTEIYDFDNHTKKYRVSGHELEPQWDGNLWSSKGQVMDLAWLDIQ